MTELISGSAGSGKGAYIVKKIRESLKTRKKLYLIVPEQQAVLWEERICRELEPSSALYLEIVSFRRLANTVARREGGLIYNIAGEGKKILLMWTALSLVNDKLKVYRCDDGRGDKYIHLMLDAVGELRMNRITPSDIETASRVISPDGTSLPDRLHDLSLIYGAYSSLLDENGSSDRFSVLETLEETLRTSDFFCGSEVFIDSFFSLTPTETAILYHIIRRADDVHMTFDFDMSRGEMHFEHIKKFYKKVCLIAERAGSEIKKTTLDTNLRTSKESLLYLERNLWNFTAEEGEGKNDGCVEIISCGDRYEEARAVGAVIERLTERGASYSDIAIVARDIEKYRGILDVRLDKLDIPYHISSRSEISASPAVKLVTGLLDVISSSFARDRLILCIKTGLCPVNPTEAANFEEYVETWNLRGKSAYLDGALWSMNPAGYESELSPWGKTVLKDANRVKLILAEPLARLQGLFDSGARVREVCGALYDILLSFGVYEKLCAAADEARLQGRAQDADMLSHLFSFILDALDTIVDTLGDVPVGAGQLSRLFAEVAGTLDVGSIPAGVDAVTLGSSVGIRCRDIKHVICIGCAEGEFPAAVGEKGFFSDADKLCLESADIFLSERSTELLGEELFGFWRALTMASDSVTITYPTNLKDSQSPSIGVREVERLIGVVPAPFSDFARRELVRSRRSAESEAPFLWSIPEERGALSRLFEKYPEIKRHGVSRAALDADSERVSRETSEKVFPKNLALTQSRIDKFVKCRFSYYMRYVLSLRESHVAAVGALDVGNLIHRILELFFTEVRGRRLPLEKDEAEKITDRIISEYIEQIMGKRETSSRQEYLFSRLKRNVSVLLSALMEEFAGSRYTPYKFELSVGMGEPGTPLPLTFSAPDGTTATLYGKIDRVDTFTENGKVYVRVVDYKTGNTKFSESDIKRGLNLQLLIYLFTLWRGADCDFRRKLAPGGEEIVPSEMLYLKALPDETDSDVYISDLSQGAEIAKRKISRSGIYLDDETVKAERSERLVGTLCLDEKDLKDGLKMKTLEQLGKMYRETEETVMRISEEMRSGMCESAPKKGSRVCEYCKFKPLCRHTDKAGTKEGGEAENE